VIVETAGLGPGAPDSIGPYQVIGVLGRGGMGKVYKGQAPGGQLVAVKVIRRDLADEPQVRARFAREVAVARRVNGLYTAHVVDADTGGPVPWMATAYFDAPSLQRRVADEGPLPAAAVRALTRALAAVLERIHADGVVHRDLKPSNILLASDGPRLIDFGIARPTEPGHTLTHYGVLGTVGYMSPERAWDRAVGPASDVFSLGVVICYAATGAWPWGTGNDEQILYRAANDHPDLSGLPEDLRDIASRCLKREPDERPSAAQILSELSGAELSGAGRSREARPVPGETPPATTGPLRLETASAFPVKTPVAGAPRRKFRRVAAMAAALALVIGLGIIATVEFSPQLFASASAPTPKPAPKPKPGPPGCPAQLTGPDSSEPIGIVTSACFPVRSDISAADKTIESQMAAVTSQIDKQNALVAGSPYRTVVFFGVMSTTSGVVNPASLYQLRGTLYDQQQQNSGKSKFKIRVLLANPGNDFENGQGVAQSIIDRAQQDSSIVAVIGIGQSWTNSLDTIKMFKAANLPVIGTSITGNAFSGPSLSNFFRISPSNTRQAQLAAAFAKSPLKAKRVLILANQYVSDGNQDLYSGDLAQQFTDDFTDSSHSVIETCDYGDQLPVKVDCGGHSLSLPELREHICQENPDLIFFAARAITLPQLFTASGGTCKLPTVLGSSDVPKYAGNTDLKNGSALYYLSFAPAKQGNCGTAKAHPYQTTAMCDFLSAYRAQYKYESTSDADDNPVLSFDSSDAMLGDDALQAVIQAIDSAGGNSGIDGAGILRELNSGKVSFNGASGLISFPAQQRTSSYHPIYVTLLGQRSLTVEISCGQYSSSAPSGTDPGCPTSLS